jgi:hypothetical protein
MAEL